MIRHVACLGLVLLAGIPLRAGELDTEFGGQTSPVPAVAPASTRTTPSTEASLLAASRDVATGAAKASELDKEMPSQAWSRGFGYGRFGYGRFGYGGFGYGRGFGYGGYGRGFGYGGYGRGFGLSIGYSSLGLGYGGLGYGGLGYGGWGYGGLGYGGLGYGGGFLLSTSYLGYGYGGFPGCYYW